jgi:cell division protein FtsI (penicillin-binding protein 3)
MLGVYNTIANGGVYVAPRLVRATVDDDGKEHEVKAPEGRRVVSEKTADQVTEILANVVAVGTGVNAAIPGYTVAGKTGTARKPSTTERGYVQGAYIASFAGFVPAESPRLSAIVVLDEPHPYYASLSSAPVFSRITQYALRQFRVPPPPAVITTEEAPPAEAPGLEVRD